MFFDMQRRTQIFRNKQKEVRQDTNRKNTTPNNPGGWHLVKHNNLVKYNKYVKFLIEHICVSCVQHTISISCSIYPLKLAYNAQKASVSYKDNPINPSFTNLVNCTEQAWHKWVIRTRIFLKFCRDKDCYKFIFKHWEKCTLHTFITVPDLKRVF